jgi:hypothetical protein
MMEVDEEQRESPSGSAVHLSQSSSQVSYGGRRAGFLFSHRHTRMTPPCAPRTSNADP